MKLEIHERLALLQILPEKGSYAELKSIRKAREIIALTQDEIEFYEMEIKEGKWHWNIAKASQRVLDVPLGEYMTNTIRDLLAAMNQAKSMTEMFSSLYEKFVIAFRTVEP